jgi:rod shape-determining protein MreD
MIRSIVFSTLIVIGCEFVQSTWFEAIAVLGVKPDLALLVILWISYNNGSVPASITGFLSGLAQDFISASPIGFNAFIKTTVASLAGLLHGSFFIDRLFLPIVLGSLATLVKALSTGFLFLVFGSKLHVYNVFEISLWLETAYNGVIAPIVFLLFSPLKGLLKTERGRE